MSHPRTTIREAIVSHLGRSISTPVQGGDPIISYPTAAAARVYGSFNRPWPDDPATIATHYPAILVLTHDETVINDTNSRTVPNCKRRKLSAEIFGVVASSAKDEMNPTLDDIDTKLDSLAAQIEKEMTAYYTVGGNADSATLTESGTLIDDSGRVLFGCVRLVYEVDYWTRSSQPMIQPGIYHNVHTID